MIFVCRGGEARTGKKSRGNWGAEEGSEGGGKRGKKGGDEWEKEGEKAREDDGPSLSLIHI